MYINFIKKLSNLIQYAAKYIGSVFLLIIGLLIVNLQMTFDGSCRGVPSGIMTMFLMFIYVILLAVLTYRKSKKMPFNYLPLGVTLLIAYLFWYARQEDTVMLSAKVVSNHDYSLRLYDNGNFSIQMREIERSCYCMGSYELQQDTLYLSGTNLLERTDSIFTYKYVLNREEKTLLPIGNTKYSYLVFHSTKY